MAEPIERRIVQDFSCYYDLYIPGGGAPKPLIIALHGYGGDKSSMMRLVRRINEADFVIAALQGPHHHMIMPTKESPKLGYGFGWLSNFKPEDSIALHHRLISEIIDDLCKSGQADPRKILLMGFSQAVGVNFRFAFTHPDLIKGVVAICGGIPGDWESEGKYASGKVDVLCIGAERDEFYTIERMKQNAAALERRARSIETRFFDAVHEVPRDSYPVINEWLLRQIDEK